MAKNVCEVTVTFEHQNLLSSSLSLKTIIEVAAANKTYLFGSFRGGMDFFSKTSI